MKERVSMNFIKQDQKNVSMSTCVCGCLPRRMLTGDGRNSYILEQAWTPGFLLSVTLLSFFPHRDHRTGLCTCPQGEQRKGEPGRLFNAASRLKEEKP